MSISSSVRALYISTVINHACTYACTGHKLALLTCFAMQGNCFNHFDGRKIWPRGSSLCQSKGNLAYLEETEKTRLHTANCATDKRNARSAIINNGVTIDRLRKTMLN